MPPSRGHIRRFRVRISYDTRTVPSGTGPSRWYNAMLDGLTLSTGTLACRLFRVARELLHSLRVLPFVTTLRSSDVDEHRSSYCSGSEGFGGGGGAYGGGFPPVRPVAGLEAHRPGDPAGGLMVLTPFSVRGAPETFPAHGVVCPDCIKDAFGALTLSSSVVLSPLDSHLAGTRQDLRPLRSRRSRPMPGRLHADIFMLHVGRWKARPPGRASSDDLHSPGQGRAAPVLCSPCR